MNIRNAAPALLTVAGMLLTAFASAQPPAPKQSAEELLEKAKQVLAQTEGELKLPGLKEPVEVLRDRWGVAHIYAKNTPDLFFAQGFVAAQDRLFQIDVWRRQATGEMAEVFGPGFVEADRFARLVRYRGPLDDEWTSYAPDTKEIATAFTAGITAAIDAAIDAFGDKPPRPKKWKPEDVLGRASGIYMSQNFRNEVARARLVAAVGIEKARWLAPVDPPRAYTADLSAEELKTIDGRVLAGYEAAARALSVAPAKTESNNWVVSGALGVRHAAARERPAPGDRAPVAAIPRSPARAGLERDRQRRAGPLEAVNKLQVYFPHLEDTVEVLQVQRVLDRMNVFLRLMHEGLLTAGREDGRINADREFVRARRCPPPDQGILCSAFPVRPELLAGGARPPAVGAEYARNLIERFARLSRGRWPDLDVAWEPPSEPGKLLGTARLGERVQPFALLLKSAGPHPLVRCVSPVGRVGPREEIESITDRVAGTAAVKIGAILEADDETYDLTVEGDCLLAGTSDSDAARVEMLVTRTVRQADDFEQQFLPDQDAVLESFREDLSREGDHDR